MSVTPQTTPPLAEVRELPAGDKITGFYLLTKIETRNKKDGSPFLILNLQDSTGTLEAKMWDGFEEFHKSAEAGNVVKLEGVIDRYRDLPGLVISRIRLTDSTEVPDRRQFLPHSPLLAADAKIQIQEFVASVKNPHLKILLEKIFSDEIITRKFLEAAGGKLWHHATLGGLAEHTLSMTRLVDLLCSHYPQLNRDLLIAGTLLHDIGKTDELSTEIAIDYTSEGRLLGHIVQGTLLVEKKISEIENFPAELRKQLLHLILSHQGDGTMGSPVKPMTLEGILLHFCDEIDSKVNAFSQVRSMTAEGKDFSDYVKLMDRFFYFKSAEEK